MIPGTSCLATIVLSLRDQSHSPIEAPHNYLSAYGVNTGLLNGTKLRILWGDQLPRRGWRTQLKVSTREGKAGRLTYFRKGGTYWDRSGNQTAGSSAAVSKASRLTLFRKLLRGRETTQTALNFAPFNPGLYLLFLAPWAIGNALIFLQRPLS